jgi:hypothetical protein
MNRVLLGHAGAASHPSTTPPHAAAHTADSLSS